MVISAITIQKQLFGHSIIFVDSLIYAFINIIFILDCNYWLKFIVFPSLLFYEQLGNHWTKLTSISAISQHVTLLFIFSYLNSKKIAMKENDAEDKHCDRK